MPTMITVPKDLEIESMKNIESNKELQTVFVRLMVELQTIKEEVRSLRDELKNTKRKRRSTKSTTDDRNEEKTTAPGPSAVVGESIKLVMSPNNLTEQPENTPDDENKPTTQDLGDPFQRVLDRASSPSSSSSNSSSSISPSKSTKASTNPNSSDDQTKKKVSPRSVGKQNLPIPPFPKNIPKSFVQLVEQHLEHDLESLEGMTRTGWDISSSLFFGQRVYLFQKVKKHMNKENADADRQRELIRAASILDLERGDMSLSSYLQKLKKEDPDVVRRQRKKRKKVEKTDL